MEPQETQNPQTPSPEIEEKVESLAAIVQKSAAENDKTPLVNKSGPRAGKRGPGRPRKNGAPNKATLEKMGLQSDPLADSAIEAGANPPTDGSSTPPPAQGLDLPPSMLKPALKAPFSILRARTGFEGFELPDDVAEECVPLFQHVLRQYLPAVDGPHAPAVMLVGTLGMHLFNQTLEFQQWKREQAEKGRRSVSEVARPPVQGFAVEHVAPTLNP
jgi:hypothetical protein